MDHKPTQFGAKTQNILFGHEIINIKLRLDMDLSLGKMIDSLHFSFLRWLITITIPLDFFTLFIYSVLYR